MTVRIGVSVLMAALVIGGRASAQVPGGAAPVAPRYVDAVNGLSLEQAIASALEREPSLRAARSGLDVATGRERQAGLRPNPLVSFEQREEPGGTDRQTMVAAEWPLDLFRRGGRVAVAEREIEAARFGVADRERMLASDVRTRYGDVLVAVRHLVTFDELVATTRGQHDLLRSRVAEGASPPLERDLLDVELRRLESERVLQAGRAEAALIQLKRVLGLTSDATLAVRDTLEALVRRESAAAPPIVEIPKVLEQRADVREAAARVDVAESRIDRAQRDGRFDVSLFASYARMDAGFPQRGLSPDGGVERVRGVFHYLSAGATVTIPVLNRNQGEVAVAQAERAAAGAAHDAARLAAGADIAAARAQDARAREAVGFFTTGAQTLAKQNLTVVGQSYELGRLTVFDVLEQQRRYLDLERAYTDALRAAYEARTALNRALGDLR
jgi:outer membrane protein, heavy metal efflux system